MNSSGSSTLDCDRLVSTMLCLPQTPQRVGVPPIKCQGIKTKLVPFIRSQLCWQEGSDARWIEPFLGSGVVTFNLLPQQALLADTNQHIIQFYQAVQRGEIDGTLVRSYLEAEGATLTRWGADYYYEVRDRFNQSATPFDFLFLNRACFNGVMRFNRRGQFNVPFCRKVKRFSRSYITKIANQVDWVARQLADRQWEFRVAEWPEILGAVREGDFVYLDPPYVGRHTDYYNRWTQTEAEQLAEAVRQLPCGFAVSMWLENQYRKNEHIAQWWPGVELRRCQHFYHVGSKETWRGAIAEALLIKPGFAAKSDQAALEQRV